MPALRVLQPDAVDLSSLQLGRLVTLENCRIHDVLYGPSAVKLTFVLKDLTLPAYSLTTLGGRFGTTDWRTMGKIKVRAQTVLQSREHRFLLDLERRVKVLIDAAYPTWTIRSQGRSAQRPDLLLNGTSIFKRNELEEYPPEISIILQPYKPPGSQEAHDCFKFAMRDGDTSDIIEDFIPSKVTDPRGDLVGPGDKLAAVVQLDRIVYYGVHTQGISIQLTMFQGKLWRKPPSYTHRRYPVEDLLTDLDNLAMTDRNRDPGQNSDVAAALLAINEEAEEAPTIGMCPPLFLAARSSYLLANIPHKMATPYKPLKAQVIRPNWPFIVATLRLALSIGLTGYALLHARKSIAQHIRAKTAQECAPFASGVADLTIFVSALASIALVNSAPYEKWPALQFAAAFVILGLLVVASFTFVFQLASFGVALDEHFECVWSSGLIKGFAITFVLINGPLVVGITSYVGLKLWRVLRWFARQSVIVTEARREDDTRTQQQICVRVETDIKRLWDDSDKRREDEYLAWCKDWILQCHRVLKRTGTCYIYGLSTTLALIYARIHGNKAITWKVDWLVWHDTNKTNPKAKSFQRSHESILLCRFPGSRFNRDLVREAYTEEYKKYSPGRVRAADSTGRINSRNVATAYNIHEDVSALSGACGKSEGVAHPSQKPLQLTERLVKSAMHTEEGIETNVLIPFAGAGTEMVACSRLPGCRFLAFEINAKYVELAKKRMAVE
ncbi:S-adenosyl-L-methionine-dependent methyltransferase [Fimicolochytrium jonesii]|uniref:S-adenosyl-L-methionine-dependent methyltransferase n=1 Tax=Fimicolochytrium jonesii TaxID=1396493 RepID=UPI0022FE51CE|nr:S-adenosyl-L-methionine-dependent methyltransferase [Fimicolochytrium jonesii]KAI8818701.1 S-adenosyl-L-methionine-dependent methyltransferase [Fimicolochytrium jonesii]